jgi:hypothetical protein
MTSAKTTVEGSNGEHLTWLGAPGRTDDSREGAARGRHPPRANLDGQTVEPQSHATPPTEPNSTQGASYDHSNPCPYDAKGPGARRA